MTDLAHSPVDMLPPVPVAELPLSRHRSLIISEAGITRAALVDAREAPADHTRFRSGSTPMLVGAATMAAINACLLACDTLSLGQGMADFY